MILAAGFGIEKNRTLPVIESRDQKDRDVAVNHAAVLRKQQPGLVAFAAAPMKILLVDFFRRDRPDLVGSKDRLSAWFIDEDGPARPFPPRL